MKTFVFLAVLMVLSGLAVAQEQWVVLTEQVSVKVGVTGGANQPWIFPAGTVLPLYATTGDTAVVGVGSAAGWISSKIVRLATVEEVATGRAMQPKYAALFEERASQDKAGVEQAAQAVHKDDGGLAEAQNRWVVWGGGTATLSDSRKIYTVALPAGVYPFRGYDLAARGLEPAGNQSVPWVQEQIRENQKFAPRILGFGRFHFLAWPNAVRLATAEEVATYSAEYDRLVAWHEEELARRAKAATEAAEYERLKNEWRWRMDNLQRSVDQLRR